MENLKINLWIISKFGKMAITKEHFKKLKQLDRIEYRQRILLIKELGNANAKRFLLWTLLLILISFTFPKMSTVILILVSVYHLYKAVLIDSEFKVLEEEYFEEEVKVKK